MEMVTYQSSCDSSYVSASASPSRSCSSSVYFYSAPTSPTSGPTNVPFAWESEPGVPKTRMEISSEIIEDFEFETSRKFKSLLDQKKQWRRQRGESLPVMSFADELFCNGQVLPLKLPPCLQYFDKRKCRNESSSASSPRSPSSVLKGPFSCLSFRNEDFDPFMAALEHVRNESESDLGSFHRRTRSLSPQRTTSQWSSDLALIPSEPSEPKSSGLASPVGGVRSSRVRAIKPTVKTFESIGKIARKSGRSWIDRCRKLRIKKFLFRSASEGRADSKDKLRNKTAAIRKPHYFRRLSFKSMHRTYYNDKKVASVGRKTLMPYRPRLFLCLGFGLKGLKNMN